MIRISCVIAAYNEASRIGGVLSAIHDHPELDEVIVVDDGSTDGTAEVVRKYHDVKLIVQGTNLGKSRAIARGVEAATGDSILTLDADLQNLTPEHISSLTVPVKSGIVDITISMRSNSLAIYRAIGLDFCSGERVFPRRFIMDHTGEINALSRFGIESFLNELIIKERLRIAIVPLKGLINTLKMRKIGFLRGLVAETKMLRDVLRVLSPLGVLRQNYWMLKLARRT